MILIRFLLISIAILYVLRLLARFLLPLLFQNIVKKAQQQQNGYQHTHARNKSEGTIKVDYAPDNRSSVPDSEGEFVEYEEIKGRNDS